MASINISEADFEALAGAAIDAKNRGDMKSAVALDKVARKINAALAAARYSKVRLGQGKPLSWQDVPSTISDGPST